MTHPGGRPRTTIPEKEELEELGKDLVAWAQEETDEVRTAFVFWYTGRHWFTFEQWKRFKDTPQFRPYYEVARSFLSKKLHAQALEKGLTHRYIGMYDRELYEYEDGESEKEAERKKKAFSEGSSSLSDYQAWLSEKKKIVK